MSIIWRSWSFVKGRLRSFWRHRRAPNSADIGRFDDGDDGDIRRGGNGDGSSPPLRFDSQTSLGQRFSFSRRGWYCRVCIHKCRPNINAAGAPARRDDVAIIDDGFVALVWMEGFRNWTWNEW